MKPLREFEYISVFWHVSYCNNYLLSFIIKFKKGKSGLRYETLLHTFSLFLVSISTVQQQMLPQHFHCQFHFLVELDFCCCSSSFFGGIGALFKAVQLIFFLSNFFLLSQHLRNVIMAELIKLTTIIDKKVKNKIPEVFVKVTQTE